jgi:hypothetical protein
VIQHTAGPTGNPYGPFREPTDNASSGVPICCGHISSFRIQLIAM